MAVSVCPIAVVNAPVEIAWRLLDDPSIYALWWDAQTLSIDPQGPARAGQTIRAQSRALGMMWDVNLDVNQVDAERRQLDLTTRLPFGITVLNHITVVPVDAHSSRISFGRDFSFSPVWWGWFLETFASRQLHGGVANALARLKSAAESPTTAGPAT